jgi:hypothetical protein
MPRPSQQRRRPADDWSQMRLLVGSAEQAAYDLLRPIEDRLQREV